MDMGNHLALDGEVGEVGEVVGESPLSSVADQRLLILMLWSLNEVNSKNIWNLIVISFCVCQLKVKWRQWIERMVIVLEVFPFYELSQCFKCLDGWKCIFWLKKYNLNWGQFYCCLLCYKLKKNCNIFNQLTCKNHHIIRKQNFILRNTSNSLGVFNFWDFLFGIHRFFHSILID